jgi:hypothetical protein
MLLTNNLIVSSLQRTEVESLLQLVYLPRPPPPLAGGLRPQEAIPPVLSSRFLDILAKRGIFLNEGL